MEENKMEHDFRKAFEECMKENDEVLRILSRR